MIYLDYSANTPVSEDVLRCFCETEREFFGNPNSTHDAGKAAKERMDEITVSIAGLMGAAPEEIIYTSCASESNNTALKGIAALARSRGMHIIRDLRFQTRIRKIRSTVLPESSCRSRALRWIWSTLTETEKSI